MSEYWGGVPELDNRDRALIVERRVSRRKQEREEPRPLVGDFVIFGDGTVRRVSHAWRDGEGWDGGVQTSDGGSWHLTKGGHVSYSGGLRPTIPTDKLTLTDERRRGDIWIFHHDVWTAGGAVHSEIEFRVYRTNLLPN